MEKFQLRPNEQKKYDVIKNLVENNANKNRAAVELSITTRQVNRLIIIYKEKGIEGFVHGNRGKKPVTTIPSDIREKIVELYKTVYFDSNFTHFTELLKKHENIRISVSTVTSILEEAGILSPRVTKIKKKRKKAELRKRQKETSSKKEIAEIQANLVAIENAHSRRPRSTYFGELQQIDASPFKWFGDLKTTLHIAVDDATGMITGAYFDEQETLNGYYNVYYQILNKYGIPYKFFSDRRTVFVYKKKNNSDIGEDTCTQFAYACKQLGTHIEYSSIPQAKGRVERMFETLQSRLPIEMRIAGVTDIRAANELLPTLIGEYNDSFALKDDYIKSTFENQPSKEKLNLILSVITERKVDSGHCVQFNNKYYRMMDSNNMQVHYQRGTKALVIKAFDGNLYCSVNDKHIYALDEIPKHYSKSKELDLEYEDEKPKKRYIPPATHPWRSDSFWKFVKIQEHHIFDNFKI